DIIIKSVGSIFEQEYSTEKIFISISIEERRQDYLQLKGRIEKYFGRENLTISIHPNNLPNEVAGAAANKAWASRNGVEFLEDKHIDLAKVIVTIPDADTIFAPDYCAELAIQSQKYSELNYFFQPQFYKVANNLSKMSYASKVISLTLTQ